MGEVTANFDPSNTERKREVGEFEDCRNILYHALQYISDTTVEPFKKTVLRELMNTRNDSIHLAKNCGEVIAAAKELFNEEKVKLLKNCLEKTYKTYYRVGEDCDIKYDEFDLMPIDAKFKDIFVVYFYEDCFNEMLGKLYDNMVYTEVCRRLEKAYYSGRRMFVCVDGRDVPIDIDKKDEGYSIEG